ncbi:hypothetical protein K492DRAFT_7017 [Lichtheimia hyalospora FSU 10163]|nr:hypothetical protein K492DRAFT_7017 [Lichtheimia hyalospora FSU 10163]
MRMVRPATYTYHRKRIVERINEAEHIPLAYYTLSHIWGVTSTKLYLWDEISEYVDDDYGEPVDSVPMRPDKRGIVLKILQSHPDSYWWIDVLCTFTDTPLYIMADIYACCAKCIALVDCEPSIIPQLNSMRNVVGLNNPYLPYENVSETMLFDHYQQLNSLLSPVTQSSWWNRVWTLQEMALPPKVMLMAEAATKLSDPDNMIDIDDLRDFEVILGKILLYLIRIGIMD